MVEKFDERDIIAQTSVPIKEETTARELFDSMSKASVQLFTDSYPAVSGGTAVTRSQDTSKKLYYTNDSIDFDRDRVIDWTKTGTEIQRSICAFSFEPFQLPLTSLHLPDEKQLQVTITRSRIHDNGSLSQVENAGHITKVTDSGRLLVATADGNLIEIGLLNNQTPLEFIESSGYSPKDIIFK